MPILVNGLLQGGVPQILEQRPPRAARRDENGLSVPRQWSVLATSEVAALALLDAAMGVRRGAPYQDSGGNIPDPNCLCQAVEALGRPPAVNGGYGQYICTAEYNSRQTFPQAIPGGPTRWSRKAALTSQPVDIDAQGIPILSSSLEPPDPPITAFLRDEVLHAEFYYRAASELEAVGVFRKFEGKINDQPAPKLGLPRGSILVHPFEVRATDTGWVYVTVDLQIRPTKTLFGVEVLGWEDVFPDRGRRLRGSNAVTGDPSKDFIDIPDASGHISGEPWPLDGSGNTANSDYNAQGYLVRPGEQNTAVNALSLNVAYGLSNGRPLKALICVCNYLFVDFSEIPFPN